MTSDAPVVTTEILGDVALICIDNPPVNATGQAVRGGLMEAVTALPGSGAKAAAIWCAGRTFVAGADIREFGKPPLAPGLTDVYNAIVASPVPVVAVMHGTALGGGYELGLACHARVGMPGLKVGLPEVTLGVLPGAGGTQRLPRLSGVAASLDAILSGRHVPAAEALNLGMIDRIEAGEPRELAERMARAVVSGDLPTRRTDDIVLSADPEAIAAARAKLARTSAHLYSPHACVDCVEQATGPVPEGLAYERKRFMDCIASPQRSGLIHAFFAERAVAAIPEKSATPRAVASVGVIGGGTMGSGIATACLLAGLDVTMIEVAQAGLDRGVATVEGNLDGAVKRGKLSADQRDATRARLTPTLDIGALAGVDMVIEAVFEDMAVKKDIFAKLDAICKPGAVLASNTSYLDVDEIATATSRPQDVIGLHFFSPAHVMRLLEVVVAAKTAPEVTATGFALAKRLGKVGVRAGVCDGFIGNRILAHFRKVADYLLLDGASVDQIDAALEGFGFAMGPFQVSDLAGNDIGWATRKRRAATRPAAERYSGEIADRISEQGWFGRKTGKGYYVYEGKQTLPNPDLPGIVDAERARAGIIPRVIGADEIVDRYMTAMISEAARVIDEGIALRPVDVDAVFLFGYGFPRWRGGPLHYADTLGAARIVDRITAYAAEDPHYWQVPPLLARMAAEGTSFADLNKG